MRKLLLALVAGCGVAAAATAAPAPDADEAELLRSFETVDVWHFPVDYTVGYNNQDVATTRELVALPPPAGKLCYIRFDLLRADGDVAYGLRPSRPEAAPAWSVLVRKIGTVTSQARSVLKMNVVYFYVDGAKKDGDPNVCARKQAAPTAQAGNGFTDRVWSDLVVRAKLTHGRPPPGE
jgi:hypothetical protein